MAEKNYKVGEEIPLGYQAPNKESGLVGPNAPIAEIYLPDTGSGILKDTNFPDVELLEVGSSGTYRGLFTPDQQGEWQVVQHKADGDGQVTLKFSVGAYNVHSVGEKVDTVDGKMGSIQTTLGSIENKVDAIDTPPMAF